MSKNKNIMVSAKTYDDVTEIQHFYEKLFNCSIPLGKVVEALIKTKVDLSFEMDLIKPLMTMKA
jgi:SUMO ligase MMS21 Smc5/6 complex component